MKIPTKQFSSISRKAAAVLAGVTFLVNTVLPVYAQGAFLLPAPGAQVSLSPVFNPILLKAVRVNADNPFEFDFVIDQGDSKLPEEAFKAESEKLVRYFLASLTTPENDLWVNLSPYEKNRIIPESFGVTEMGRDLLAQDYLLKQITATLMYPEGEVGKKFWDKVHKQALEKFGTSEVPTNTFNKVWIVPQKAVVYENGPTAYIAETHLKVMLEEDYVALSHQKDSAESRTTVRDEAVTKDGNALASQIVREIIIPELEKEVNEGTHFAGLRQVYNSLILANWYKKRLKDSILAKIYVDKNKVAGVDIDDKEETQKIYQRYVEAFQKGVYNYIREDYDPVSQESIPRKYFSGGVNLAGMVGSSAIMDLRMGLPPMMLAYNPQLRWLKTRFNLFRREAVGDQEVFSSVVLSPHQEVNELIQKELPKDLKNYGDLSPEERSVLKDRYRDVTGRIVIPIGLLLPREGLLAHIGIGQAYGEPVIYIDSRLTSIRYVAARKAVLDHMNFRIARWEEKRRELNLDAVAMRKWIQQNSNAQGTGEAQRLEREWYQQAPSLEPAYQDQDISFILQQNRLQRVMELIEATAAKEREDLSSQLTQLLGLPITEFISPWGINLFSEEVRMAYVFQIENPWGLVHHVNIRREYADALNDGELLWVMTRLWLKSQIEEYSYRNKLSLEETERLQSDEVKVDALATWMILKLGFDPAMGFSALVKEFKTRLALPVVATEVGFIEAEESINYEVRGRAIEEFVRQQSIQALPGIYEADVPVGALQQDESVGIAAPIVEGIPDDLKDYANLSPEDQESVKAKYRNENGRMVVPYRGLFDRVQMLGRFSLNSLYGEPVIIIDSTLEQQENAAVKALVVKHFEYVVSRWEEKMKELGLSFGEIGEWISKNLNQEEYIEKAKFLAIVADGSGEKLLNDLIASRALQDTDVPEGMVKLKVVDLEMASGRIKEIVGREYYTQVMAIFKDVKLGGPAERLADEFSKAEPSYQEALRLYNQIYPNRGAGDESAEQSADSASSPVGGIDLSADKTQLDIRSKGAPVEFNFDPGQLQNLKFDGFVPVIINVTPMTNLPLFLTENSQPSPAGTASQFN